ncbi:MAG: ABC transporter permease [Candidatus Wallbacteria bacterium]|nr:ABC transporter permease [Candidatus Wallbacteria bacterium]
MRVSSYLKGSVTHFRTNVVRTLLTLLGIVFGVASVIAMITIGEGAQRQILSNIEAMGATLVHIVPSDVDEGKISQIINDSRGLSLADVGAIESTLPMPGRRLAFFKKVPIRVTNLPIQTTDLNVYATSDALRSITGQEILFGRDFLPFDSQSCAAVSLLTESYARRFLGQANEAVGRFIRLNYRWFQVIGVVGRPRPAGNDPVEVKLPAKIENYQDAVFLPLSSYRSRLESPRIYGELSGILVDCRNLAETNRVKSVLEKVLASAHRGVRDFTIVSPKELLEQQRAAQAIFNVVLLSIAAISLLVGGIGIMNIMLANVMERRSEIGIRRALGAKKRHIVIQFLLEAVLVCLIGGVMGIVLGVAVSLGILRFTQIPIAFSTTPIVASFVISMCVGLLFGILPAKRAAEVNPVEALHNE